MIGYIQYYNVHDLPLEGNVLKLLPKLMGALDLYTGAQGFLQRRLSGPVIENFLNTYLWKDFDFCLAAPPNTITLRAIKVFEKLQFQTIDQNQHARYMLRSRKIVSGGDYSN